MGKGCDDVTDQYETKAQTSARNRSLWIVHLGMTIFSMGFSIVLTGVYPYMKQLLPPEDGLTDEETKDYNNSILGLYGWVVGIMPLGQMIFSPIFGVIANKMGGSIRLICLVTAVVYTLGNILYSILSVFPESARFGLLLVARFLVGASSANAAPMRSYVTSATFQHERTKHISYLSAAQSLGFIIGPALQAAFTPVQCSPKAHEGGTYIALDMYTVCGWVSALFGVITFITFLPFIFKEFDVTKYELGNAEKIDDSEKRRDSDVKGSDSSSSIGSRRSSSAIDTPAAAAPLDLGKPDYVVVSICLFSFFCYQMNFVIVESLGTPLSQDQFGWTESESILFMGILLTIGACFTMAGFASIAWFASKFDERMIQLLLGGIPLLISRLFHFPLPGTPSPQTPLINGTDFCELEDKSDRDFYYADDYNSYSGAFDPRFRGGHDYKNVPCTEEGEEPPYCGYDWCCTQAGLTLWQFILGFLIIFIGYPFAMALAQSIMTKNLGPRPMGVYMGLITASGSLARFLGPVLVSYVYKFVGMYVTNAIILGLVVIAMIVNVIFFKRMVPYNKTKAGMAAAGGSGSYNGDFGNGIIVDDARSIGSLDSIK